MVLLTAVPLHGWRTQRPLVQLVLSLPHAVEGMSKPKNKIWFINYIFLDPIHSF